MRPLRPLPHSSFEILLTLAAGPAHGYGIKRSVEERTDGAVRLGAGTLYTALQRLETNGHIREVPGEPSQQDDSASVRWRFYELTDSGLELVRAEVRRLERALGFAHSLPALRGEAV